MRMADPELPMLGVEPAIKPAAAMSHTKRVGVMATPATLQSDKFQTLLSSLLTEAEFVLQACEGLADAIEQRYGALQGLLHSAAEFSAYTPLAIHKTQDWGHTLNVNLNAPFLLTRVLLPLLQNSLQASIVFTSDSTVREPKAYSGAYGVSKIAVEGLAKILAEELEAGQKVRVNTLIPGPVDSPMRKKAFPAEDKTQLPSMSSLDSLYCYLFDNASSGMTGQTIDAQTFKF
jgi:NAD(P)-dependent dehydrogenase (short-subunit alcohol dehydrogenase family)